MNILLLVLFILINNIYSYKIFKNIIKKINKLNITDYIYNDIFQEIYQYEYNYILF